VLKRGNGKLGTAHENKSQFKPPGAKILTLKVFANKLTFYIYQLNIGQKNKSDGLSKGKVGLRTPNNQHQKVCHQTNRACYSNNTPQFSTPNPLT
jgi:hypothetical protein